MGPEANVEERGVKHFSDVRRGAPGNLGKNGDKEKSLCNWKKAKGVE